MADSSSSTLDPSALAQLLALLQKNQQGTSGTPPTAPNQVTNNQGMAFQLGANNTATPENPGSSPEFSAPGTLTSLPTSGMSDTALQNWYNSNQGNTFYNSQGQLAGIPSESGGGSNQGNSYGMAAPSQGGTPEPGTIRAMMNKGGILNGASLSDPQSDQFNQLVQGLLKQYQSQPQTAPSAAQPVLPPPAPTVPNNQVAYTDPSKAVIPGMGVPSPVSTLPQAPAASLPAQLQQGMTQQDIMAQGGPLQASTGSGIAPGSMQIPASYNPGQSTSVTAPIVNQPVSSGVTGTPNIAGQAAQAFQKSQNQGIGPATKSYSPSDLTNDVPQIGTYNALNPATSSTTPGNSGVLNTASDPDPDPGLAGTGIQPSGGMTPQMGNALASGISQAGAAIQGAYKPIALKPVPTAPQPKPPSDTPPTMIA